LKTKKKTSCSAPSKKKKKNGLELTGKRLGRWVRYERRKKGELVYSPTDWYCLRVRENFCSKEERKSYKKRGRGGCAMSD